MRERRNDLEIRNEIPQIALQIPNSDRSPLYDVRNPACASREGGDMRSDVFADGFDRALRRPSDQPSGGARRDRTDDLMLAKHALSQLSYGPVTRRRMLQAKLDRHMHSIKWWAWEDLNFRPHAYQARALTN